MAVGLPPDLLRIERSKRAALLKASQQRKQEMKNLNKIVIIGAGATGLTSRDVRPRKPMLFPSHKRGEEHSKMNTSEKLSFISKKILFL